jgi:hypothetical protein
MRSRWPRRPREAQARTDNAKAVKGASPRKRRTARPASSSGIVHHHQLDVAAAHVGLGRITTPEEALNNMSEQTRQQLIKPERRPAMTTKRSKPSTALAQLHQRLDRVTATGRVSR